MKPATPVIEGADLDETVYAKDQPPYIPLPAYKLSDERGTILTRWKLSWLERLKILFTGNMYLWVQTFGKPLQPVMLQVETPKMRNKECLKHM